MNGRAGFVAVTIALVAMACGRGDAGRQDSSSAAGPATPPAAGTYTVDDFKRLLWIAGQWQGFMQDGSRFFERYRFLDDSTFVVFTYADSTMRQARDSARVALRGGTVSRENGGARWVATRLDSIGVDFAPERNTTRHLTWAREEPEGDAERDRPIDGEKWNATLRWTDERGRPQSVLYALHRFGR